MKWDVFADKWMGQPGVMMLRLNQFDLEQLRRENLKLVQECLEEYFDRNGFVHEDVAWRNVGYFNQQGEVHVVMLDLSSTRVVRKPEDREHMIWVERAAARLEATIAVAYIVVAHAE